MNLRQKAKRLKQENERLRKLAVPTNIIMAGDNIRIVPVRVSRICNETEMLLFEHIKTQMLDDISRECRELVEIETEPEHNIILSPRHKVTATLYVAVKS